MKQETTNELELALLNALPSVLSCLLSAHLAAPVLVGRTAFISFPEEFWHQMYKLPALLSSFIIECEILNAPS